MGAVMASTQPSEMEEQQSRWIEMKELSQVKVCQYCKTTVDIDEPDGIFKQYDRNNNEIYEVRRLKMSCQGCEKKYKERIIVEQHQRQSPKPNIKYEYVRQTSRGS